MSNFMFQTTHNTPKTASRRTVDSDKPSLVQARLNAAMHVDIAERARTSRDVRPVTKVDASMSREEIIAKIMGAGRRTAIAR